MRKQGEYSTRKAPMRQFRIDVIGALLVGAALLGLVACDGEGLDGPGAR